MIEQTLVLVKPDGVARGLIGEILQRFERAGLKIIGLKMIHVDKDFSKEHYSAHVGKDFYTPLENFITSGPVVAMAIEGIEAVELVRKMVGSTEPKSSAPGTIRGDYAHTSYGYSDGKKQVMQNLIHASGTTEEAKGEVALWFSVEELHKYKRTSDDHIF